MWWNQLTLTHTCWIIAWSRPSLNFWGLSLPAQLSLQSVTFWKLTRQANIASSSISFANCLWLSIMTWNGVITLKWSTFPFWCWLQAATALPEISHNTQFDWSVPGTFDWLVLVLQKIIFLSSSLQMWMLMTANVNPVLYRFQWPQSNYILTAELSMFRWWSQLSILPEQTTNQVHIV